MIAVNNFHSTLSEKTSTLHKIAERSGFNKVLFEGKASRGLYGKYLLHKYHIYNAMESMMEELSNDNQLSRFLFPELKRKQALANDLDHFIEKGWDKEDMLSTAASYIYHLHNIASEKPALLIAHAYVHYFADLSGGFIIKKILKEQYNYKDGELNAYNFKQIENVGDFKKNYLNLLDNMVQKLNITEEFVEESKLAYIFAISALMELVS